MKKNKKLRENLHNISKTYSFNDNPGANCYNSNNINKNPIEESDLLALLDKNNPNN